MGFREFNEGELISGNNALYKLPKNLLQGDKEIIYGIGSSGVNAIDAWVNEYLIKQAGLEVNQFNYAASGVNTITLGNEIERGSRGLT